MVRPVPRRTPSSSTLVIKRTFSSKGSLNLGILGGRLREVRLYFPLISICDCIAVLQKCLLKKQGEVDREGGT